LEAKCIVDNEEEEHDSETMSTEPMLAALNTERMENRLD
jgi:hypothetical protein